MELRPDQLTEYNMEPFLAGVCEDPRAWLDGCFLDPEFTLTYPVMLPMIPALRKIRGLVDKVHIVTARPESLRQATLQWLDNYQITYDKLVMTDQKDAYCRELQKTVCERVYIVEDAPHHAEACHAAAVGVFLMDKAYNRTVSDRGGLWRIEHPLDIVPILKADLAR